MEAQKMMKEMRGNLRLLAEILPVLRIGYRSEPPIGRSELSASKAPISLEWLCLLDARWPKEPVHAPSLSPFERPYGAEVTVGLWAKHCAEALGADINLGEQPSIERSTEFLLARLFDICTELEEAPVLHRTLGAILKEATRLAGEEEPEKRAITCTATGCGNPVERAPGGWRCTGCGEEYLIATGIRRLTQPSFTAAEIAEKLGISSRTVRRYAADGLIQSVGKRGSADLFEIEPVEAILRWGGEAA